MSFVDVEVPDGCYPGDAFMVLHGDQEFEVVVPDGCGAGSLLTVDVPPLPEPQFATVEVEVLREEHVAVIEKAYSASRG